jgi:hypothetical protein
LADRAPRVPPLRIFLPMSGFSLFHFFRQAWKTGVYFVTAGSPTLNSGHLYGAGTSTSRSCRGPRFRALGANAADTDDGACPCHETGSSSSGDALTSITQRRNCSRTKLDSHGELRTFPKRLYGPTSIGPGSRIRHSPTKGARNQGEGADTTCSQPESTCASLGHVGNRLRCLGLRVRGDVI